MTLPKGSKHLLLTVQQYDMLEFSVSRNLQCRAMDPTNQTKWPPFVVWSRKLDPTTLVAGLGSSSSTVRTSIPKPIRQPVKAPRVCVSDEMNRIRSQAASFAVKSPTVTSHAQWVLSCSIEDVIFHRNISFVFCPWQDLRYQGKELKETPAPVGYHWSSRIFFRLSSGKLSGECACIVSLSRNFRFTLQFSCYGKGWIKLATAQNMFSF